MAVIGDSWQEVDFNRDGVATVAEVQVRFQRFAKQANLSGCNDVTDESRHGRQSDNLDLPSEFLERDANGNGQIEMHEFAEKFDAALVDDYYSYDRNRDGLITSGEWLSRMADLNGAQPRKCR